MRSSLSVRPGRLRRSRAGFTLVELIVVVIIIAVLAALAIPAISNELRDRRTQQVANELAGFYRNARTRAMGRGAAVLVRFEVDGASPQGRVTVMEAVRGAEADTNCNDLPISSCNQATWIVGNTGNKVLSTYDPTIRSELRDQWLDMYDATGAGPLPSVDVCFTPMGRSWMRLGTAGPFVNPLNQVMKARVRRLGPDNTTQLGLARTVLVIPNGHARQGPAETP